MITNHPFKDLYDTIITIGYYSGFYSSLKPTIWSNGGYFEIFQKMKINEKIYIWNPFLDFDQYNHLVFQKKLASKAAQ